LNDNEGIYLEDEEGDTHFVPYNELDKLDDEVLRLACRPITGSGFIYPAEMFVQMPVTRTPFYIQNWLPKHGKMCVYAPAKTGKSTLAVQGARVLGIGNPFLGIPTQTSKSLYIQSELAVPVLQQRMRDTGQRYPNMLIGTLFSMKIDTPTGQSVLAEAVLATQPNVLILDPLYKMMQGDENETHDMLMMCDFLDQLIESVETDLAIWITHHSGKDLSKGGRGSSVLEDWVDSNLELKRISKKGDALRVQITPKLLRHSELPPESMEAEWVQGEFVSVGAEQTLKDKLVSVLADKKEHQIASIIEEVQASRAGVNKIIDEMVEAKLVERTGRGLYKLT
jgi:hypothetical protein